MRVPMTPKDSRLRSKEYQWYMEVNPTQVQLHDYEGVLIGTWTAVEAAEAMVFPSSWEKITHFGIRLTGTEEPKSFDVVPLKLSRLRRFRDTQYLRAHPNVKAWALGLGGGLFLVGLTMATVAGYLCYGEGVQSTATGGDPPNIRLYVPAISLGILMVFGGIRKLFEFLKWSRIAAEQD